MNYQEACNLSPGQRYAFAMPLKALSTARPIPEQEAMISCFAPVDPDINSSYQTFPDREHVSVFLFYLIKYNAYVYVRPWCNNAFYS